MDSLIGRSAIRREDITLLSGGASYTDDLKSKGLLHMSIVRSPYAHALIKRIDFSKTRMYGEIVCLDGESVKDAIMPLPIIFMFHGTKPVSYRCLAVHKVRFVGEPVAVVLSDDRSIAEDARDDVDVEYEPLLPLVDAVYATDDKAPRIHDDIERNIVYEQEIDSGEVDLAFGRAKYVVERKIRIHRQTGAPIEPRNTFANFDSDKGILTVRSSTQIPHSLRDVLASCLGLEKSKIRVIAQHVGGSFGNYKYHAEDVLAAYSSIITKRPVKWTADRKEIFLGNYHAREQIHKISVAADESGVILGLKDFIIADHGAYLPREGVGPSMITSLMLTGPYKIKNVRIRMQCVLTNKTPTGAYRGFGHPEACFAIERIIDALANEINIDRAEIRLKNFIGSSEFPYLSATGLTYDSGNYSSSLEVALTAIDYRRRREERIIKSRNGKKLGCGFAFYTENTGFGPTEMLSALGVKQPGFETAVLELDADNVRVKCGLSPHGQGSETSLSQVVATVLEIPLTRVIFEYGDTFTCPQGQGTFASRNSVVGSALMDKVARQLLQETRKLATEVLDCSEVSYSNGVFSNTSGTRQLSLFEMCQHTKSVPISVISKYDPIGMAFPFGCHAALVEVDEETGKIKILRYVVVHDCGKALNPMIVEGQSHGGAAQGIAGAILEELPYNEDGQPLASTFADYLVPTAADLPDIEVHHTETPTNVNALGVKGTGESATIPSAAAIASALQDALGCEILETPFSPERIWRKKTGAISSTFY